MLNIENKIFAVDNLLHIAVVIPTQRTSFFNHFGTVWFWELTQFLPTSHGFSLFLLDRGTPNDPFLIAKIMAWFKGMLISVQMLLTPSKFHNSWAWGCLAQQKDTNPYDRIAWTQREVLVSMLWPFQGLAVLWFEPIKASKQSGVGVRMHIFIQTPNVSKVANSWRVEISILMNIYLCQRY